MKFDPQTITVNQLAGTLFQAIVKITHPFEQRITMTGRTSETAKEKLILFLANKTYHHLD